jgi:hypothetical protein
MSLIILNPKSDEYCNNLNIINILTPELRDTYFDFCGRARWGLLSAGAAAKKHPYFAIALGVSISPSQAAAAVSGVGRLFRDFLGLSERPCFRCEGQGKIAAAPADGRPQRASMRIDRIA